MSFYLFQLMSGQMNYAAANFLSQTLPPVSAPASFPQFPQNTQPFQGAYMPSLHQSFQQSLPQYQVSAISLHRCTKVEDCPLT